MKIRMRTLITSLLMLGLMLSVTPMAFAGSAEPAAGRKLVALTFDDGPGEYADDILDTLQRHNAKGTFFLLGHKVRTNPDQVRRMAAEGHQIGNHTESHPHLTECSDAAIQQEVKETAQAITEVTGLTGTGDTGFYLRPPFGSYSDRVAAAAHVPVIWCTVDSGDWKYQNASRLVSYTGSVLQDGDIVILHETHKSTAQGLDALLTKLDQRGFELVTVDDLFWRRGVTPNAGQIYYSAKNTGINRCEKELYWDESRLNTHWAWDSISYVMKEGLMTGNEYGEFTPQFPLTRGMFVTVLGRLSGVEAGETPSGFADIPAGHYAAPYAAWAKETGVMVGLEDGSFGVNSPLTRQQMAVALARYAQLCGAEAESFDLASYKDSAAIADWAREGVAQCSALGLLKGSEGSFRPNDTTNRAMGAVILHRLCEFDVSAAE